MHNVPWAALLHQFGWGARRGVGSYFLLEFGRPHLVVCEPHLVGESASEARKKLARHRRVSVHGEWSLWVQSSQWKIVDNGMELASADSDSMEIDAALRHLDGLTLLRFWQDETETTLIEFELSTVLRILPDPDDDVQWSIFDNDRCYASYRNGIGVVLEDMRASQS